MNVTHYFALCVSAATGVFERAGITDEYRADRGTGFFTGEHHIRYYPENAQPYGRGVRRRYRGRPRPGTHSGRGGLAGTALWRHAGPALIPAAAAARDGIG
ncbi:hypothetical protein [Nocardia grenadensis]|uniref:hypothetical protein n=1 Tax=Nocardia grenadensis TaxID=931537 RepID=UPI003D8DF678